MLLLLMRVSFSFDFISIDCVKIKANRIWIEFKKKNKLNIFKMNVYTYLL